MASCRAAPALALAFFAGCGGSGPYEIAEVREAPARLTAGRAVTTAERFGLRPGASDPHAHHAQAQQPQRLLDWTLPDGWSEGPAKPMRLATFLVDAAPEIDCSLSTAMGGVLANVGRWAGQMGLQPPSSDEVAAMEKVPMLGGEAVLVDFEGTYAGMGEKSPEEGSRMIGLILASPRESLFLKMVGPSAAVAAERERLLRLAASIRLAEESPAPATGGAEDLVWQAPESWEQRPNASQFRLVTFGPKDSPETECHVTVMAGEAGGLHANVDMWRSQIGRPPATDAEVSALPTIPMLGREGTLVEIAGAFTGKAGRNVGGATLLGAMCFLEDSSVFVKMVGPADVVAREKENFLAFCASLKR